MAFLKALHRKIPFSILFITETLACQTATQRLCIPNIRKVVLLKCHSIDLIAVHGKDLAVPSGAPGFQTVLLDNS